MSPRDLLSMFWMFSPAPANVVEIWPSMFGTLALAMASRYFDSLGMAMLGKLTEFWMLPFSR